MSTPRFRRPSTAPRICPSRRSRSFIATPIAMGLKGCTAYRPNAVTGSVLATSQPSRWRRPRPEPARPDAPHAASSGRAAGRARRISSICRKPLERDQVLSGYTYKLKWADSDHAIYVTINDLVQDGRRRPVRDFHQLEESGALCLDGGADADDQRGLPAGRRRVLRRRGVEGGVRSARRTMDGRALCAEPARGDRRDHRAAYGQYRISDAGRRARMARRRSLARRSARGGGGAKACPRCGSRRCISAKDACSAGIAAIRNAAKRHARWSTGAKAQCRHARAYDAARAGRIRRCMHRFSPASAEACIWIDARTRSGHDDQCFVGDPGLPAAAIPVRAGARRWFARAFRGLAALGFGLDGDFDAPFCAWIPERQGGLPDMLRAGGERRVQRHAHIQFPEMLDEFGHRVRR